MKKKIVGNILNVKSLADLSKEKYYRYAKKLDSLDDDNLCNNDSTRADRMEYVLQ